MKKILLTLIFILLLNGCTASPQVQTTTTSNPQQQETGAYPVPETVFQESTSYPVVEEEEESATVTPAPGTGKVAGSIKLNQKPVKDALLYLATFLKDSKGVDFTAVIEPATSSKAYTDDEGKFLFVNVIPGEYSLVLDNVTNQFLLFRPGTQDHFKIQVTADATVDLGELNYDELPIRQP